MADTFRIYVTNESQKTQDFFFFQKPVTTSTTEKVLSNSLLSSPLRGQGSGATLTFEQSTQLFAGAETKVSNRTRTDPAEQITGTVIVAQEISVQSDSANSTDMQINPLGLTVSVNDPATAAGAFQIATPAFNPSLETYGTGLAIQRKRQPPILSSFIEAVPNRKQKFTPHCVFYVQLGTYPSGEAIDFSSVSENAAECDCSDGVREFNVVYQADGRWKVNGSRST